MLFLTRKSRPIGLHVEKGLFMTNREQLVKQFWLEDMTFDGFCYIVKQELEHDFVSFNRLFEFRKALKLDRLFAEKPLLDILRNLYDNGIATYATPINERILGYVSKTK